MPVSQFIKSIQREEQSANISCLLKKKIGIIYEGGNELILWLFSCWRISWWGRGLSSKVFCLTEQFSKMYITSETRKCFPLSSESGYPNLDKLMRWKTNKLLLLEFIILVRNLLRALLTEESRFVLNFEGTAVKSKIGLPPYHAIPLCKNSPAEAPLQRLWRLPNRFHRIVGQSLQDPIFSMFRSKCVLRQKLSSIFTRKHSSPKWCFLTTFCSWTVATKRSIQI